MYLSSVQIQQVAVKSVKLNESTIYFVVLKVKGIQQQLIQKFQEIPSTFYELAVHYINNSPINQKYRDFSRVSYYILPIYRALFRLQVINSIFCLLPSLGCRPPCYPR